MADVGVGVRDLFQPFEEREEGGRAVDRVDLEFVGEIEERLEEDASSNVGKGEKDVEGMVSCGSCDRAGFGSEGECGVLRVVKKKKMRSPHEKDR